MAMSIVGLVLGIVALTSSWAGWWSFVSLAMAIVGLVLSCKARGVEANGINKAGKIVGIIAVIVCAVFACTCGICDICLCIGCEACDALTEVAVDMGL